MKSGQEIGVHFSSSYGSNCHFLIFDFTVQVQKCNSIVNQELHVLASWPNNFSYFLLILLHNVSEKNNIIMRLYYMNIYSCLGIVNNYLC